MKEIKETPEKQIQNHDNASKSAPVTISSEQLLGPLKRLDIEHRGDRYTLRITANGKLILTK